MYRMEIMHRMDANSEIISDKVGVNQLSDFYEGFFPTEDMQTKIFFVNNFFYV